MNGLNGLAGMATAGTTTTGAPGSNATVTNVGTLTNAVFDFVIPRGDVGATGSPGVQGYSNARWNHAYSTILVGAATLLPLVNSGYGLVAQQNGPGVPANGDSWRTIEFQIAPGTYTLYAVVSTLSNRGLATLYLDSSVVSFGTLDGYNNAGLGTVFRTIAGVVIPASVDNLHTIRGVISAGTGGGFFFVMGEMLFK